MKIALLSLALGIAVAGSHHPPVHRTASYYADHYEGAAMADGRPYRRHLLTAASNDWPLGTILRVHHGDATVTVTVTDRMARRFTGKRIDLSKAAFLALSPLEPGLIPVEIIRLR